MRWPSFRNLPPVETAEIREAPDGVSERARFRAWHAAAFLGGVTALSALASSKDARGYWTSLNNRSVAPPAWVFPSVWAGVNVLQLWADLRILNQRDTPDRKKVLGLRAVNWLLYALFTPTFFRGKGPVGVEAVTLAEGVTAGATLALLARKDPLAAAALVPLTLWTAYASLVGGKVAAARSDNQVDQWRWGGAI